MRLLKALLLLAALFALGSAYQLKPVGAAAPVVGKAVLEPIRGGLQLDGVAPDRAARMADGFLISGRSQDYAQKIKTRIEGQLDELGRERSSFGFESIQSFNRGPNRWPEDIAAWQDAGGSHISIVTMGADLKKVDDHIDAIRQWREVYDSVG